MLLRLYVFLTGAAAKYGRGIILSFEADLTGFKTVGFVFFIYLVLEAFFLITLLCILLLFNGDCFFKPPYTIYFIVLVGFIVLFLRL